jgi:hypothetical protein
MKNLLSRISSKECGFLKNDGSWTLIKSRNEQDISIDLFKGHITKYLTEWSEDKNNPSHISDLTEYNKKILNGELSAYVNKFHPGIKLLDISNLSRLCVFTYIIASNIDQNNWIGGNSGSVQFKREDAVLRTLFEIVERTELKRNHIDLSNIWGSSVTSLSSFSSFKAEEEALERFITFNTWNLEPGYFYIQIPISEILLSDRLKSILYEWKKYSANLEFYFLKNPFKINVVLIKIQICCTDSCLFFYSNGIGENLLLALEKALLESLQFVQADKIFKKEMTENPINSRILDWQKFKFTVELGTNIEKECSLKNINSVNNYKELINSIFRHIGGETITLKVLETHNLFLGYSRFFLNKCWYSYKGIPIA